MANARGKVIATIIVALFALASVAVLPRIFFPVSSNSSTASSVGTNTSSPSPAITVAAVTAGVLLIVGVGVALRRWLRKMGESPDEDAV